MKGDQIQRGLQWNVERSGYAPQGGIDAEEREHLEGACALFTGVENAELEVYLIHDDGEVGPLAG